MSHDLPITVKDAPRFCGHVITGGGIRARPATAASGSETAPAAMTAVSVGLPQIPKDRRLQIRPLEIIVRSSQVSARDIQKTAGLENPGVRNKGEPATSHAT